MEVQIKLDFGPVVNSSLLAVTLGFKSRRMSACTGRFSSSWYVVVFCRRKYESASWRNSMQPTSSGNAEPYACTIKTKARTQGGGVITMTTARLGDR